MLLCYIMIIKKVNKSEKKVAAHRIMKISHAEKPIPKISNGKSIKQFSTILIKTIERNSENSSADDGK